MTMTRALIAGLLATLTPMCAASAQTAETRSSADPTAFASAANIAAAIADMEATMKPGQTFMWRPLLVDGKQVAAIEYWKAPGKPAIHPIDSEYVVILAGAGTMVSGGTMADQEVKNPHQTDGSRIDGGVTRRLVPGDAFLVPAGVPHWFGVDGGKLVMLGTKIPKP